MPVHPRRRVAPDHALPERKKVQVYVLDRVARGPFVLDDRRADARDLVRGDRGTDARAAEKDPALDVSTRERIRERSNDEWVIVVGSRLGSKSNDPVSGCLEVLGDRGLEALPRVVCGDPDIHATVARTPSISAALIAPCRTIFI